MDDAQVAILCTIARRWAVKMEYPGPLSRYEDIYGAALEGGLRFASIWDGTKGSSFGSWVGWGCRLGIMAYFRGINGGRGYLNNFKQIQPTVFVDVDQKDGESVSEHMLVPHENGEATNWIGFWDTVADMLDDERSFACVYGYFCIGMEQKELAEYLGVSAPWVSQLITKALAQLKDKLEQDAILL